MPTTKFDVAELRNKYVYSDISIMSKTSAGTYVNITDFSFEEINDVQQLYIPNVKSRFIICLYSYARGTRWYSEISLAELLILADINSDSKFIKQLQAGIEETVSEEIIASVCANKILNYQWGKINKSKDENNHIEFRRLKFNKEKRREYPVVLIKKFSRTDEGEDKVI